SERPLSAEESLSRDIHEVKHLRKAESIALADHFALNNGDLGAALREFVIWLDETVRESASDQPSEMIERPAAALAQAIAENTLTLDTPWDAALLMHRAVLERNPILTWYACKAIGDATFNHGVQFLCWVGQQPDVDLDTTSLHRIAAWALGRIRTGPSELLRERLDGGSSAERSFAADALGEMRDSGAIGALGRHLREDDIQVALWAALSLTKIPVPEAADELERVIVLTDERKRRYLGIDALARVNFARARDTLLRISNELDDEQVSHLESAMLRHQQASPGVASSD
ncbi:MAG: HEAT repeat domain-containing protein, partial [Gammaproteobacteria bacterium]